MALLLAKFYGKTPRGEIIDALVGFYEDK